MPKKMWIRPMKSMQVDFKKVADGILDILAETEELGDEIPDLDLVASMKEHLDVMREMCDRLEEFFM